MADVTSIGAKAARRRELVLQQLLEALNNHDVEDAVGCFAHPRYELIATQRVYDGAEDVRGYYTMILGRFPDLAFELIAVHHSPDATIAEMWMSGTHLGSGPDFEATGRHFRCRSAIVFDFDDYSLAGARVYYDTGTIARQLA